MFGCNGTQWICEATCSVNTMRSQAPATPIHFVLTFYTQISCTICRYLILGGRRFFRCQRVRNIVQQIFRYARTSRVVFHVKTLNQVLYACSKSPTLWATNLFCGLATFPLVWVGVCLTFPATG